jgi:hypothetical protein
MAGDRGQTKTHDRCRPWVVVEIALRATSPGGIVCDDDDDDDDDRILNVWRN